ncbi:acyl-CoA desaturase [Phycicoccus endophyticus]|uniref:Acyl-CoA desaturase n=1 Tax=Phycicoccus endophyticus TaxID=1690220 RepID=A0A7G9R0Q3_9MICO|nr:acyl-CoA desaturase [Phycicoccus endophyticus]NHI19463.1 acyl-CoA desaturase [Phycicoccus endophyticus]QNN49178.1 acyl-CoA desaturase [Phycicoccus endophyticus]GGL39397.1 putative fatty acid desaturase [Phycicoccus endophyticus]
MTLAPQRADHASTKPQGINPRLRVTSDEPRPQRAALTGTGRPNPAAHLSPDDIEGIGHELDALRQEVMDSRGDRDAAYIRKVIRTQRYLEMGSRALLLFSNVKVKGFRPAWWLGTAGLSVSKILENMEIGHNVMHGQWDWMRDPKIHSTAWEWDNASPASQWKHSHNEIHHTFTNVLGRDNDLGYGILRVDEDQPWSLFYLFQPIWHVGNALVFEYSIAAYDLELGGYLAKRERMSEEEKATFRANRNEVLQKIKRQATKDYVVHPALSAVSGSSRTTLTANVVANLVRNLWTNTVIICGHFPPGISTFEKTSIDGETRGEWYLRQMLGSGNISGTKAMHVITGNLSHQIEHHLFPDMPSNRYAEIAPRIRDLMQRNDLPYVTGSLWKQAASVYLKVVQLSLPNKVEGERRRDVVRRELGKAWRSKKLGRRY